MIINKVRQELIIYSEETILNALKKIDGNTHRIVFIVNEHQRLQGCITDGDFRRWVFQSKSLDLNTPLVQLVNSNCVYELVTASKSRIMSKFGKGIDLIPLVDEEKRLVAIAFNKLDFFTIGDISINEENRSFIIAEIGNNHNGNFELAKKLVDESVKAGADCAKFQMRNMQALYSNSGNHNDHTEDLGSQYTLDLLAKNQMNVDSLYRIFDYCKSKNIIPLCTPWDYESLLALEKYGMDGYKIASADLTNHDFLRNIANTRKPIICSTGMSTEDEIRETVNLTKELGIQSIFLHCNSTYPVPFKDVNLSYLKRLKEITGFVVGYSGHERGINIALAAVALGAKVIEKHITLDRNMEGNDHKVSLLPEEFADMVKGIREVEESLGKDGTRVITQGEVLNRENLAKSLVINRDLNIGEVILEEMVEIKSPGKGLQPNKKKDLIGRVVKRNMKKGDFFYFSELLEDKIVPRNYTFNRPWGVAVRYHDFSSIIKKTNLDFVEFHLSYKDLEINPSDYLKGKQEIGFMVHTPELFKGDHVLDLCSFDNRYRKSSISELQKVIDITLKIKDYFPVTKRPLVIVNVGGFSMDHFISEMKRSEYYLLLLESLSQINSEGVEIIPQTMPPFPWHFGGQRYHNLFMNPDEIAFFCKTYSYRVCLDISHSKLACNYFHWSFKEFMEKVGPHTAHLHIVDAKGVDEEGLQIGDGDIDFVALEEYLENVVDRQVGFIPEIWQGHKNDGEGFWVALDRLEKLLGKSYYARKN